jgi:hypothetical protein
VRAVLPTSGLLPQRSGHWALPEAGFEGQLSETLYHEGAHEEVGPYHGHDSSWSNSFACYSL